MKRISTFVVLLVLLCGVSQGRHTQRYQVHYNPYAFNYHSNGLVGGGMRYSMHAFNYGNSGLIQEYQTGGARSYNPCYIVCNAPAAQSSSSGRCSPARVHSAPARRFAISAEKLRRIEEKDGLNIIRQYLAEQGLKDVRLKHHLSIENQTVGTVLVVADSDLVITYRNTEAIISLAKETGYKKLAVERFERQMADASATTLAAGGQVYAIDASGKDQVLVAMQDCAELNPDTQAPAPATMYAKN